MALRGADAADHGRRRVGAPVDRAVGLAGSTDAGGRSRADRRSRPARAPRPPAATAVTASRTASIAARRTSCRYRLLLPASRVRNVRAAQTRPPSTSPVASSTVTPHSAISSSIAQSSEDGPRSPFGPGMHDQATMFAPDGVWDDRLEHRADDQLGRVARHRRLDRRARVHDLDRDSVTQVGQGHEDPLAETVVGRGEEQDPQRPLGAPEQAARAGWRWRMWRGWSWGVSSGRGCRCSRRRRASASRSRRGGDRCPESGMACVGVPTGERRLPLRVEAVAWRRGVDDGMRLHVVLRSLPDARDAAVRFARSVATRQWWRIGPHSVARPYHRVCRLRVVESASVVT